MKPIIVHPGEGKSVAAFGEINTIKLSGTQTGGAVAVMMDTTPAGVGPPLHRHVKEDEIFLVSKGRISYCVDDQWTEVGVGGVVYLPKGCVHSYRNIGEDDSQHWIITLPAGFETFFSRCGEEFKKGGEPDMQKIMGISQDHGIEFV